MRGAADDAQLVAQPLHRRAGDRYRTLERVNGFGVPELVADRGQQAIAGSHDRLTGVQQQEIAGAVSIFRFSRVQAHLPDHGRVLVAEDTGDRHLAADGPSRGGDTEGLSR